MKFKIGILLLLGFICTEANTQISRLALSPFQKIEQKIAMTDITITCSRPSQRGRMIFGGLVPYNQLWRTGANRNTTIAFTEKVHIGDHTVKPGKYAIFTTPREKEWEVIFYNETDHWDVPREIDSSKVVARITVPSKPLQETNEVLSITIGHFTDHMFNLDVEWERTKISVPIQLNTAEQIKEEIQDQLAGPDSHDYYLAARYEVYSGSNPEDGLEKINKAIAMEQEERYWFYDMKCKLLKELGRKEEAREIANKGLAIVKAQDRQFMIEEFEKFIKEL